MAGIASEIVLQVSSPVRTQGSPARGGGENQFEPTFRRACDADAAAIQPRESEPSGTTGSQREDQKPRTTDAGGHGNDHASAEAGQGAQGENETTESDTNGESADKEERKREEDDTDAATAADASPGKRDSTSPHKLRKVVDYAVSEAGEAECANGEKGDKAAATQKSAKQPLEATEQPVAGAGDGTVDADKSAEPATEGLAGKPAARRLDKRTNAAATGGVEESKPGVTAESGKLAENAGDGDSPARKESAAKSSKSDGAIADALKGEDKAHRGSADQSSGRSQTAEASVAVAAVAPIDASSGVEPTEGKVKPERAIDAVASAVGSRGGASLDRLAGRSRGPSATGSEGDNRPTIDRSRFLQRVEGAFRAAQQRDGRVQVRLSPSELGSLRIELTMHNGALTARVEAETSHARTALLDNLPALRERLAQQDIRIEKFDVDVGRGGGGWSGGASDRSADQPSNRETSRSSSTPKPRSSEIRVERSHSDRTIISTSGLDVRV